MTLGGFVVPCGWGECEDVLLNSDTDVWSGAWAVAFEAELVFEGVEVGVVQHLEAGFAFVGFGRR
ncbi:MAG: hypothetical protein GY925_20775 [Actinomycetia bacterium]|nr:hypothetical protein [Actinomycetes bacterium]